MPTNVLELKSYKKLLDVFDKAACEKGTLVLVNFMTAKTGEQLFTRGRVWLNARDATDEEIKLQEAMLQGKSNEQAKNLYLVRDREKDCFDVRPKKVKDDLPPEVKVAVKIYTRKELLNKLKQELVDKMVKYQEAKNCLFQKDDQGNRIRADQKTKEILQCFRDIYDWGGKVVTELGKLFSEDVAESINQFAEELVNAGLDRQSCDILEGRDNAQYEGKKTPPTVNTKKIGLMFTSEEENKKAENYCINERCFLVKYVMDQLNWEKSDKRPKLAEQISKDALSFQKFLDVFANRNIQKESQNKNMARMHRNILETICNSIGKEEVKTEYKSLEECYNDIQGSQEVGTTRRRKNKKKKKKNKQQEHENYETKVEPLIQNEIKNEIIETPKQVEKLTIQSENKNENKNKNEIIEIPRNEIKNEIIETPKQIEKLTIQSENKNEHKKHITMKIIQNPNHQKKQNSDGQKKMKIIVRPGQVANSTVQSETKKLTSLGDLNINAEPHIFKNTTLGDRRLNINAEPFIPKSKIEEKEKEELRKLINQERNTRLLPKGRDIVITKEEELEDFRPFLSYFENDNIKITLPKEQLNSIQKKWEKQGRLVWW